MVPLTDPVLRAALLPVFGNELSHGRYELGRDLDERVMFVFEGCLAFRHRDPTASGRS